MWGGGTGKTDRGGEIRGSRTGGKSQKRGGLIRSLGYSGVWGGMARSKKLWLMSAGAVL